MTIPKIWNFENNKKLNILLKDWYISFLILQMELTQLLLSALVIFVNGAYSLETNEDTIIDKAKTE